MKEKNKEVKARAEVAEKSVLKLQKEVDRQKQEHEGRRPNCLLSPHGRTDAFVLRLQEKYRGGEEEERVLEKQAVLVSFLRLTITIAPITTPVSEVRGEEDGDEGA